jgi:hypothetical protein
MRRNWVKTAHRAILSAVCGLMLSSSAAAQTTTRQIGSFVVATVVDPMTDAKQTTVMSAGNMNQFALGWTCRGDGLGVVLTWQAFNVPPRGGLDRLEVQHRIAPQAAVTTAWTRGRTPNSAVLAKAEADGFTKKALQQASVVVRLVDWKGEAKTDTIPFRGLSQALRQLPCRAEKKPK